MANRGRSFGFAFIRCFTSAITPILRLSAMYSAFVGNVSRRSGERSREFRLRVLDPARHEIERHRPVKRQSGRWPFSYRRRPRKEFPQNLARRPLLVLAPTVRLPAPALPLCSPGLDYPDEMNSGNGLRTLFCPSSSRHSSDSGSPRVLDRRILRPSATPLLNRSERKTHHE